MIFPVIGLVYFLVCLKPTEQRPPLAPTTACLWKNIWFSPGIVQPGTDPCQRCACNGETGQVTCFPIYSRRCHHPKPMRLMPFYQSHDTILAPAAPLDPFSTECHECTYNDDGAEVHCAPKLCITPSCFPGQVLVTAPGDCCSSCSTIADHVPSIPQLQIGDH